MSAAAPKVSSCRITPARVLIVLLVIESVLWLSDRLQWFAFNRHKGFTLLIAVASVGLAMLVMFFWFLGTLLTRRRLKCSIRCLLLVALVVAIPATWWAMAREASRGQREAVEQICHAGGVINGYDYDHPLGIIIAPPPAPPGPRWLRKVLGDDLFANVTRVDLSRSEISDAGLEHLKGLAHLRDLVLHDTAVTDAGLEHLKGLTHLSSLILDGTKVSDVGLRHLQGLTDLKCLSLDRTRVTDAGLEHLKGLIHLRALYLDDTKVTDTGLQHLQGLTDLEILSLRVTTVGDAGLEHLKGMRRLRKLLLAGTNVSDVGLEHLKGLTELRSLYLAGTNVTQAGAKNLQRTLPDCEIRL